IEGRAIGGGAEVLMALDMRFAARSRAVLGMFEAALGTIPGAGGTQRLPRLVGRARALEVILGSDEFDADAAERYGWINRAFDAAVLWPYVNELASRISSAPLEAIKAAKVAVNAAESPLDEGLAAEGAAQGQCFQETAGRPSRMGKFLELGGQQSDFELTQMRDALTRLGTD
ncbi:MAG: enoyl-CoA hydratase/isomerase family protein, partial [Rhodospirillaceae bacterium]|nr:enoyl-CoA hydratase/isomerase family protein [Rhodospirillaceae bacterium]